MRPLCRIPIDEYVITSRPPTSSIQPCLNCMLRPTFPLQGFVYTEIQFIEKSYMVPTLKEK
ncbi:hypothetical protein MUK42_13188 [Musa troglodytarum]|uniref:Uncharacterized protein n=1 Tax=Musa troglodytarum TaxID=320322 RepID=A0A9E7GTW7_9LILI|nr:hypothetical protein MUK42_13188 [Musa troglodytarum]URE18027.1 hypothetical protein MUK42_13188 [Musa troglodytarum]